MLAYGWVQSFFILTAYSLEILSLVNELKIVFKKREGNLIFQALGIEKLLSRQRQKKNLTDTRILPKPM